jgi:UDP-N-acetylglucosamine diphosphorylase/glucosamine-1-phosphate N-acetyltransferase
MNYILFDGTNRNSLLPLTFTRPVADLRIGISTIKEKWETYLTSQLSYKTQPYLSKKYKTHLENDNIYIDGSILPNKELVTLIKNLTSDQLLMKGDTIIALRTGDKDFQNIDKDSYLIYDTDVDFMQVNNTWDIFRLNPEAIVDDFNIKKQENKSIAIPDTNFIIGSADNIYIEEGAKVEYAYLNTNDGPIYIGKDAEIMEGSKIRGPFALCEHATIKMDAKIYSGTTIGPYSKAGGEISNSVIMGYSNKGHDGFLGNSVIGEWCNLGADTNTSNLKNTYDFVRLWSYDTNTFENTGLQFCGLIMGDHSKSGINTMFNTGTVIGVSSNLYGSGFQRNFVSSFQWGGTHGLKNYNFKKSIEVAKAVYKRRNMDFEKTEEDIFKAIHDITTSNV